jgi:hypothetical protein
MRLLVSVIAVGTACGFQTAASVDGTGGATADAPMADAPMIDFLPPGERADGAIDWEISSHTVIDTSTLTIVPAPPAGISVVASTQVNGAAIAIVRVKDFTIGAGSTIGVKGTRPFAVLASHDVTIHGTLDVGAHLAVPGPGGALGGMGAGAGGTGVHDNGMGSGFDDAGGGGGSYGTAGARGGSVGRFDGGAPGPTYPLGGLVGGSGGGRAGVCAPQPGAGGGALLLYAGHQVTLDGMITAGGGGGAGGVMTCPTGASSGTGGGSGGTIWIQTPRLAGAGVAAANGGGGGGGSYINIGDGGPGQDGLPSATLASSGGTRARSLRATEGGRGAIEGAPAPALAAISAGNGGGGGGGLGRIVLRAPAVTTLESSPAAVGP